MPLSPGKAYAYDAAPPPPPLAPPLSQPHQGSVPPTQQPRCIFEEAAACYDYTDTECLSDNPPDVTEIYRRKAPGATCYHRNMHISRYCNPPQFHQTSPIQCVHINSSLPNTNNLQFDDNRYRHYKSQYQQNQDQCDIGLFRSLPYVSPPPPPNLRIYRERDVSPGCFSNPNNKKKYPVTVRTPRYYRCPTSSLYKRPSRLCLPMSCEPDPGYYRRPRRSTIDDTGIAPNIQQQQQQQQQQFYCGRVGSGIGGIVSNKIIPSSAYPNENPSRIDPMKRCENLLKIDSEGDLNNKLSDTETYNKFGVGDISKFLRPRVPASIRQKRENILKLRVAKMSEQDVQNYNFHSDSLDVIHDRLSKCEEVLSRKPSKSKDNENKNETPTKNDFTTAASLLSLNVKPQVKRKQSLDDNYALELQRSKNYIISLIDKAMSVELGTIPDEKCERSEFENLNAKKAISFLNRHTSKQSDDIQQPDTTTTVVENQQIQEQNSTSKTHDLACLKELKEFKRDCICRIQNDVKKLEEIETFLELYSEP